MMPASDMPVSYPLNTGFSLSFQDLDAEMGKEQS
jgi:hypothetical protein